MKKWAFPGKQRKLSTEDFRLLRQQSLKKYTEKGFIVFVKENNVQFSRLGYIIPKREIPSSVKRSLFKRIIRETFRLNQDKLTKLDYLFIINKKVLTLEKNHLRKLIEKACLYFNRK